MIHFRPTSADDLPEILDWITKDLHHAGRSSAEWWMQGTILSTRVDDEAGPVMYLRIDREAQVARLHIQFGPMGRTRITRTFLDGIPNMVSTLKQWGYEGIVFESVSDSLIAFMGKMGFEKSVGDDYLLKFAEVPSVRA